MKAILKNLLSITPKENQLDQHYEKVPVFTVGLENTLTEKNTNICHCLKVSKMAFTHGSMDDAINQLRAMQPIFTDYIFCERTQLHIQIRHHYNDEKVLSLLAHYIETLNKNSRYISMFLEEWPLDHINSNQESFGSELDIMSNLVNDRLHTIKAQLYPIHTAIPQYSQVLHEGGLAIADIITEFAEEACIA